LIKVGITANFSHPDPERALFKGKRLLMVEESMLHWMMAQGVGVFLIPTDGGFSKDTPDISELVSELDGVLFLGGTDVSPESYGEAPMKEEWAGDRYRDLYEMRIYEQCLAQDKPVLGICRGLQLVNVAERGTLYQDINEQVPGSLVHRDWNVYDQLFHKIKIVEGSGLASLYPEIKEVKVNSIHHQGIKDLAPTLKAEAYSLEDEIIEAVRLDREDRYVFAVQWHPEFQNRDDENLPDPDKISNEFVNAIKQRMK
jgi:putative glutamine amidotransferase